jgi:hypothetical protein
MIKYRHIYESQVGWFICNRFKKKEKAEGKTCHAKTMLSLEKPIKLL